MVLQLNNLKKINKGILDYYDKVLHLSLDSFSHPDLSRIGQVPIPPYSHSAIFSFTCAPHSPVPPPANEGSKADMARLLQLVLGIAINCERKESEYYLLSLSSNH